MKKKRLRLSLMLLKTSLVILLFLIFLLEFSTLKQTLEIKNYYEMMTTSYNNEAKQTSNYEVVTLNSIKEITTNAEKQQIAFNIVNVANADQDFMEQLKKQIQLVPNEIVESFSNDNWEIYITNEDIKKFLVNPSPEKIKDEIITLGLLKISDNRMYIRNHELAIDMYVVIHEFGHYADKYYGFVSNEKKWKRIYKKEKGIIKSEIKISDEKELFAEIFAQIMTGREENKDTQAYQYVKELIETNN